MNEFFFETTRLCTGFNPNNCCQIADLQLQKGQLVSLLGRNGAGKSTFLQTLSRQIQPIQGQVFIQNKPIQNFEPIEWAQMAALVNTEKIHADFLTGEELVKLGLYPHLGFWAKISEKEQAEIAAIFERLEIGFLRDKFLNHCSDGEKQLLHVARALAQRTEILILDEITAHLDFVNRRKVFEYLQSAAKEAQKLVFIATHELDLAAEYSDKMLIFAEKRAFWGDLTHLR